MAVPEQTPYNVYNANGATTVFPYEFYLIDAGDLSVSLNGSAITTGFSISNIGNVNGGNVTFLTPPAAGVVVMLERVIEPTRTTDYQDNGDLLADTVNLDFDRIWMAIKQALVTLGVALTRPLFGGPYNANGYRIANLPDPVNDQDAATKKWTLDQEFASAGKTFRVTDTNIPALPVSALRANKIPAFDGAGNPTVMVPVSGSAADVLLELRRATGAAQIGFNNLTVAGTLEDLYEKNSANTALIGQALNPLANPDGAGKVGYLAKDSGIVNRRTVQARLRDQYTIKDFKTATDSDWTNAFQRAALSGETLIYLSRSDTLNIVTAPIVLTTPISFLGYDGAKYSVHRAHSGPTFDIRCSNVAIEGVAFSQEGATGAGAGGSHIVLNSAITPIETIRVRRIEQRGGTGVFIMDTGGSNVVVDLILDDIKLQGILATGIVFSKVLAYLKMNAVTVNYVPSSSKNFIGISITGNEGALMRDVHVNHGITSQTPNSYGFAFQNCKALWLSDCMADTCGADGFNFYNCNYIYGSGLSASLCGGAGFRFTGGQNIMMTNLYAGGRRGLPYDGAGTNIGIVSTATAAYFSNCIARDCAGSGLFTNTGSSTFSGGGILNCGADNVLGTANHIRNAMSDSGALINVN